MKKLIAVLVLCMMITGIVASAAVPVSAATPKERIVTSAEENLPKDIVSYYLPTIENILSQVTVSEEQADQVIDCILESRKYFEATGGFKGPSLHDYTDEQVRYALQMVYHVCDILNLRYEYVPSTNPKHTNDMIFIVYNASGQKLGEFDGDAVKKTNVPDGEVSASATPVNYGYVALAAVLVIGAAGAVVVGKKLTADR